jgi:hypothetical protein
MPASAGSAMNNSLAVPPSLHAAAEHTATAFSAGLFLDAAEVSSAGRINSISSIEVISDDSLPCSTPCILVPSPDASRILRRSRRVEEIDKFGLSSSQQREVIKPMEKLQRGLKKVQRRIVDAAVSSALVLDLNDSVFSAAEEQVGRNDVVLNTPKQRVNSEEMARRSRHHPSSDSTAHGDSLETRVGRPRKALTEICKVDQHHRPDIQQPSSKNRKSTEGIQWPMVPEPSVICALGCENHAVASFSCSHNFCGSCLCGIRKHQKTKKSEIQKMYVPFLFSLFRREFYSFCLFLVAHFKRCRAIAVQCHFSGQKILGGKRKQLFG